jgi:hypothetical protein
MSDGELAYLALVVGVMVTFVVALAWASWDEGRSRKSQGR